MAEQETENQTTEQVEGTQEAQKTEIQDVQTEQISQTEQTEQTEEESKKSIVGKIGDMLSAAKERITGGNNDEQGDEIPDEFTEAARKMNWSDEDTMSFAAGLQKNEKGEWIEVEGGKPLSNEVLLEMIPSLTGADAAKADETAGTTEIQEETVEKKVEDSQEGEELKQALTRIAALEEKQGISEKESAEEEQASFVNKASDLFDKVSEEFEVFGKTDDLLKFPHNGQIIPTSPQMKARNEVWDIAHQLKEAGMPGDKALEFSLNAYKGAHLAIETKRNVIKDLKTREQKLGGKRVSHEVVDGNHGKELSGPEVIAEVARRHGVEIAP